MKRWKVFHRLGSFFKGQGGTSAANPTDEQAVKFEDEAQMSDKSMDLEDLDEEEALLALLEKSLARNRELTQQLAEMTAALAQAPAQMQSLKAVHFVGATVHFEGATINIPNDAEAEPMTPPTKDMGVDPIPLDTTTMGIADTLPAYHAGDNGLPERNLYSSETKKINLTLHFLIAGFCKQLSLSWNEVLINNFGVATEFREIFFGATFCFTRSTQFSSGGSPNLYQMAAWWIS